MPAERPPDSPADGHDRPAQAAALAPRWGLGDAAAGFLVALLLSAILAGVWTGATGEEELSLGGQALAELGLWTGLVGCVVLAAKRKGSGRLDTDFGFTARWVDVPMGAVVGALAHEVLVPIVAFLMRPLVGEPDISGPAEELFEKATGLSAAILVLFVVVGAPLVEELFFRGLVLRSLQRRVGAVAAILLCGVLFGLAHPQPLDADALALLMVSLAAFGAVLAVLAVRTGRLGAPIVAHATFNAWTAVFLLAK